MEKSRNLKGNSAITLIALIITIIVMLILVVVSVRIALSTGLFESAGKATQKLDIAQEAEKELASGKITIGNTIYDNMDDYINKVTNKPRTWITVYEGELITDEGSAVIRNLCLLEQNTYYRITVESDEYTGTIEAKAVCYEETDGMERYALFAVENGNVITFESEADLQNKIENMGSGTVLQGSDNEDIYTSWTSEAETVFIFLGATCEYTITKIEKELKGTKIYEGEFNVQRYAELPIQPDLVKKHGAILEYNGKKIYTDLVTRLNFNYVGLCVAYLDDILFLTNYNRIALCKDDIIIKTIYEFEEKTVGYVEENGFGLMYMNWGDGSGISGWSLVKTPDTDYIVPENVGGQPVEIVVGDSISGNPIFEREVILKCADIYNWKAKNIKVATQNYEFIFEIEIYGDGTLDLSECGDNVQIPSFYLEEDNFTTIYVNPEVKSNYAEYDKVVAK